MGPPPPDPSVAFPKIVFAGTRRSAETSSPRTPHFSAAALPSISALSMGFMEKRRTPDSMIALANRPLAKGEDIKNVTETPPEDSPNRVMLSGSPPNDAMFRLTHFRAAIWSRTW